VDPTKVDALVLTHRHLDHVGDATAVVEAMTRGGFAPRGLLVAPRDALEVEPVVFRYAQGYVARREVLAAGSRHAVAGDLVLEGALSHDHGVETYGYRLRAPDFTAGHVVDTFWLDALAEAYAGVDLLVVNATRLTGGDRRYLHLGADEAGRLAASVRPRLAVLTHFGMQLPPGRADEVARALEDRTGVAIVAARDGWLLDLRDLAGAAERRRAGPGSRR
jgi:ribonuclease BN (tRNA processing enzyme)